MSWQALLEQPTVSSTPPSAPPVNRAARLQGFAARDRQRIILSEATKNALPDTMKVTTLGELVELKGFSQPQSVYVLRS